MLKVFLVEDEFVIRQGIKNSVDWASHGYEFCGEASDGELAFPMIQRERPDIVITDIKMPFMDGLALSSLIKKEFPWMEVIILTGYEEFAYAKEGIRLGVSRYLLKPINGEELLREVDGLAEKIREKRLQNSIQEKYKEEMEERQLFERKEFFRYLMSGELTLSQLLDKADQLSLRISALWYNVVLLRYDVLDHVAGEYSADLVVIEEKLPEMIREDRCLLFDRNLEGKALVFKADSEEELEKEQKETLEKILSLLRSYENVRFFGGIGRPVNRLRELPQSFREAGRAFAHRFLTDPNRILDSRELSEKSFLQKEDAALSTIDPGHLDRNKIMEFLRTGDEEETDFFMEEFFRELGSNALESTLFRQYITLDTYFSAARFLEELGNTSEESRLSAPGTFHDEAEAFSYMVKTIKYAISQREKAANSRYRDVVLQVMTYIGENYAKEELSLNQVASHVNFSPNHLSTIFSQETGIPFIRYVTDLRMNKAKELLRCTGKKASAISQEVGYRDPHYFSYLFKKTQGLTPTQYRNREEPAASAPEGGGDEG